MAQSQRPRAQCPRAVGTQPGSSWLMHSKPNAETPGSVGEAAKPGARRANLSSASRKGREGARGIYAITNKEAGPPEARGARGKVTDDWRKVRDSVCAGVAGLQAPAWSRGRWAGPRAGPARESVVPSGPNQLSSNWTQLIPSCLETTRANSLLLRLRAARWTHKS